MDWQSLTAAGIVTLTVTLFLIRLAKPRKKSGCGNHCNCSKK